MLATKHVTESFRNDSLERLLSDCLTLTYSAIHYGEKNGITNRKWMKGFYRSLKSVELPSCYKVAVTTKACAVPESRRKSQRRGVETHSRKPLRLVVCVISGFFVTMKGRLLTPLRKRNDHADVVLNSHVQKAIEGKRLRSLTITLGSLSLCYSVEVEPIPVKTVFGVDRNEKNLNFGNWDGVVQPDLSETVRTRQTTRKMVRSFKRAGVRLERKLTSKY